MCATSIGSTFSHNPVPGLRKSGIPEGTEIPAPVRTTADRAEESSAAKVERPPTLLGLRTGHWGLDRHFPSNLGCRLPRNAPIPSFASSEPNTAAKPCALGLDALVEVAGG